MTLTLSPPKRVKIILPLPEEHIYEWLDCAAADYDGVSTFDRDLLSLLARHELEARLQDADLKLVSVEYLITKDFDFLAEVCTAMQLLGAKYLRNDRRPRPARCRYG